MELGKLTDKHKILFKFRVVKMKDEKNIELDIDLIGKQSGLSKKDELKISDFINSKRKKRTIKKRNKAKVVS